MARSTRKPYSKLSPQTSRGKAVTSRRIRRTARQLNHMGLLDQEFDFNLDDPLDKTRGNAGSRDRDHGWNYFDDGDKSYNPSNPRNTRK